jgi:hypothetical protein
MAPGVQVSAGTLMVFAVVAVALLWHRYNDPKTATFTKYNGESACHSPPGSLAAMGCQGGVTLLHPTTGWETSLHPPY